MSITSAYRALNRLHQSVTIQRKNSGSYVNGEWVPGSTQPSLVAKLASVPLTPKQVQTLPEGQYTTQDRFFYQIGNAVAIQKNDRITLGLETFVVQDISDRLFDGGFLRYLAKKEIV